MSRFIPFPTHPHPQTNTINFENLMNSVSYVSYDIGI